MIGRRLGLLVAAVYAVISLSSVQAASPRQSVLLGPITDASIAFGGGAAAKLNSSAASGSNGVLLNFTTSTAGGASDQVAFEWEAFDRNLSGYDNFTLNINPTPGFQVGGAQVFIRSADPLNPTNQVFTGGAFTALAQGANNRVSINMAGVPFPNNVIGFGVQMFTNGFSIPGATAVISTASDFTTTEDVLFNFNDGMQGWEPGFQAGHTHSLIPVGTADGTQALGITRSRVTDIGNPSADQPSFSWGSQRRFVADPDGEGPLPADPAILAQIANLESRINAADAIAFDVTLTDPFPNSVGFAGFHLEMTDGNNFYQGPGQFFNPPAPSSPETHTYMAQLDTFVGQNGAQPGGGLPVTNLGFQADGFARFTIASNTNLTHPSAGTATALYEIDNVRLISQAVVESADFDVDSDVDAADLAIWQAAYNSNTNNGDADFDGDTDGRDFLIWQRQVGGVVVLASSAVPEPSSVMILVVGCVCGLIRRK